MNNPGLKHVAFDNFLVREYIQEYYSKVDSENEALVGFDVRILDSLKNKFARKASTMIDFGFGGVMATMLVAAPYMKEIYVADYPQVNIEQSILWQNKSVHAYNWSHFTERILAIEHEIRNESAQISLNDIDVREEDLRKKIKAFFKCDAHSLYPLGHEHRNKIFDLVYIGFVHESMVPRREDNIGRYLLHEERISIWKRVLKNTLSLVGDDGTVIIKALGDASEDYPVADQKYPTLSITEDDLEQVLLNEGFKEKSFIFESIKSDDEIPRGYPRMICIKAEK